MSTKKLLKEAREAINNKEYQLCIKLCREILKEDKSNYMALVFFGISLQEIGPLDQAPNAFKKAIQIDENNLIAYKGLAGFYEKHDKKELFEVYKKIINLDCNEKNIIEYGNKILKLDENVEKIVEYFQELIDLNCLDDSGKSKIKTMLCDYLCGFDELKESVILTLKDLFNATNHIDYNTHKSYIKFLLKIEDYRSAFEESLNSYDLYKEKRNEIVTWITDTYNKLFFNDKNLLKNIHDKIQEITEKNFSENNEIDYGYLLTKSILYFNKDEFQKCLELLQKVTLKSDSAYVWILKSMAELALCLYNEAKLSALKSKDLICNINDESLEICINKLLIKLLSYSDNTDDWKEVMRIVQNDSSLTEDLISKISLIRVNINLGHIETADELIKKISDKNYETEVNLLKAKILKSKGMVDEAIVLLENQSECDWKSTLEIGDNYWEQGNYEKSLLLYLKAAKLNQNSHRIFLELGKYYKKFNQLDKARRCYEKVIKLNDRCIRGVMELNTIYKLQKNWESSAAILETFISEKPNTENLWIWVQLGLTYYEMKDYTKAINTLRVVIRLEPNNRICWEALADAYLSRGAYMSAIKSFQKSLELNPNALYPQIQIASIQQILGQYKESKEQFQSVLINNKLYIPGLKGLAETYLCEAKEYQRMQLFGLARDSAQSAADTLTLAISQDNKLSCVWKLLGDCCCLIATLSERYCCLKILKKFVTENDDSIEKIFVERIEIYELALRCYSKAIVCIENNVLIWHDLAKCYLSYAKITEDQEKSMELFNKSFAAIHHCIMNNPSHWSHWNLMGVLAFFKEPKSYSLSQHSFIKATTLDKNSSISWCNLGTLYLHLGEIKLANEAFSQAQRCDPNYINSWIGQALIAEFLGHEDCMDLFRHSTQLGCHEQSEIGYAYWVCKTLLGEQSEQANYAIYKMHAIPVACDHLVWYTELNPDDASGWNMLGLLKERMGFKSSALESFKHSLVLTKTEEERDKVFINYGRLLTRNHKYQDAVKILRGVKTATFNSGSALALALFKNKEYEDSYSSYESALHWLTDNKKLQSDLLVALASMAYLFEGHEAAKTLLFQSLKLKPTSPWGYYSTLSIGLLHNDLHLSQLVLNELSSIEHDSDSLNHYAILSSYFYLLKGDSRRAIRHLSELVHRHPHEASLWLSLAILLVRLHEGRPRDCAAAQCARIATELGQTSTDVTRVLCLVALSLLLAGNRAAALKAAQKAVFCYPDASDCWTVLLSSMKAHDRYKGAVEGVAGYIKKLRPSEGVLLWVGKLN